MFFLKELPSRKMLERYKERYPEMNIDHMDKALHLMRDASLLIRKLERYFAESGLSQTRVLVLIVLDREIECEYLMIGDLVQRLDVSKPVVTKIVQTLEKDGLVRTEVSKDDQRVRLVFITSAGREKLHSLLPGYYRLINEEMSALE